MAEHKDYGLSGVHQNLQLGKQGPQLKHNGDGTLSVTDVTGNSLTTITGANATQSNHLVTKAQLDAVSGSISGDGFSLQLGNINAEGDGSWTDGAVQTITNSTSISESIDQLNEALENVRNNTFVKDVDFTVDTAVGGSPLTSTLTITTTGNASHYNVDWGDGTYSNATTDSTPSHTYTNNTNSPFDVVVTAYNDDGSGTGSTATESKVDFITLYTSNPVADFDFYAGATGGSPVTIVDDGTALYFENTTTNIGSASATYLIEWGDSSADSNVTQNDFPGGEAGSRLAHTFTSSTETDQEYTVKLTLSTHSTADPSVVPNNVSATVKVYDTHTPEVALDTTNVINEDATSGGVVTFTNNTESTIGSYADFGIQYRYNWGDGTSTTVNVGSGSDGDTGDTISHTYSLSGADQSSGANADFTGNLEVISSHTGSPFKSADFTVHLEPDVRADITGTSTTSDLSESDHGVRDIYNGTDLSGTDRAEVTVVNNSQNGDSFTYAWGDGDTDANITSGAGFVGGGNITHSYLGEANTSYTLTMTASGTPDTTAQTDTDTVVFTLRAVPSAPAGVSSKTLHLATNANHGNNSKLVSGANDSSASGLAAGTALNTNTARRYDTTTSISTDPITDAYNSYNGNVTAYIDGVANGTKQFTSATGETGTFTSMVITSEGDAHDEIGAAQYPDNFYQVFTGRITIDDISSLDYGIHDMYIGHDSTGNTNNVHFVYDNVNTVPTLDISGASLQEETNGSLRYVSGVPYYNSGSPTVKLVGATVTNLIGQAYKDDSGIFNIKSGTNTEGSGTAVVQNSRSYAQIDGAVSMLSGGIPTANVGVGSAYTLGNISIDINNNNCVEPIKFTIENLMGTSATTSDTSEQIQVWASAPTFDEGAIPVADSLGAGFDDDGVRVTGFGSSADTPVFDNTVNNYTANVWSGAETIAGTSEAVNRFNTLQHYDTDLSSGYLPVGPDLNTGRSGAQYFTFAFRRTTMSNFDITLTGTVSGVWIAAPGTSIDSASGLNGWVHAGTTYGGAGTPGSNTGSGGNGSDGCAFTSGDRIIDGTSYSNDTFTMTLGDQNATNSTGNNILVRIKLEDGDSLTALSIS